MAKRKSKKSFGGVANLCLALSFLLLLCSTIVVKSLKASCSFLDWINSFPTIKTDTENMKRSNIVAIVNKR